MHGIIHRSLKQYVVDRTSDEAWKRVVDAAGIETRLYLPVSEYPDEEVGAILTTVSELTGHSEAAVQRDFGRYFAPKLLDTFDAVVDRDWDALDVVAALEDIYPDVVDAGGDPDSVRISTRRPDPRTAVVHYRSARRLCPLLEGIVEGIAAEYGVTVDVETASPTPEGLRHCELTVRR